MTMPKFLLLGVALLVIAAAFLAAVTKKGSKRAQQNLQLKPRRPLSPFEEKMFVTLRVALPDHIVLAQVSFSALVTSPQNQRNYYDRKHADFVICDKALTPIVIIELDDASHRARGKQDAKRDAMLAIAGYKTIRYTSIPTTAKLKADITALNPTTPQTDKIPVTSDEKSHQSSLTHGR